MKKIICLLLALAPLSVLTAQNDLREGFIITLENDTLKGLADYKENASVFRSVKFKKTETANVIEYGPKELRAYGFKDDRNFVSLEIPLDSGKTQLVFSEILVKGKISLYRVEQTYYIQKDAGTIYPLRNKKENIYKEGVKYERSLNEHLGILTMLMSDCPELKVGSKKEIDLKQKVLVKLCLAYNVCKGESAIEFKEKKTFLNFSPALAGGISSSRLESKTNYPGYYFWLAGSYGRSTSAEFGLLFDLSSPRMHERLSLTSGVLTTKHTYTGYTKRGTPSYEERNYTKFKMTEVKIPLAIKYTFPTRVVTPYVFGGASVTFFTNKSAYWKQTLEEDNDVVTVNEIEQPVTFTNKQIGFLLGVGGFTTLYKRTKIFAELRYERSDGVVDYPRAFDDSMRSFQLLMGLKF